MCPETWTTEKKVFPTEKQRCFPFSSVWSAIYHIIFYFHYSVWIRIRIQFGTFYSDSDPAKIFKLFRIWIHNTARMSPVFKFMLWRKKHLIYRYRIKNNND
jgi:hypothetical protein